MNAAYEDMTTEQLRKLLASRGQAISGTKAELTTRLISGEQKKKG